MKRNKDGTIGKKYPGLFLRRFWTTRNHLPICTTVLVPTQVPTERHGLSSNYNLHVLSFVMFFLSSDRN